MQSGQEETKADLLLLVADVKMESSFRGLLERPQSLGIRPIQARVYRHPRRDPAVYRECHDFLRSRQWVSPHALVIFDREGCGSEASRQVLEDEVETRLAQNGWKGRSAAVVIDPELKAWVWSGSPHVDEALGWPHAGLPLGQ
jgi:hypothetical protein